MKEKWNVEENSMHQSIKQIINKNNQSEDYRMKQKQKFEDVLKREKKEKS